MMIKLYERFHQKFTRLIDCQPIFTNKLVEKSGFKVNDNIELTM
jgi:hypothetical protein